MNIQKNTIKEVQGFDFEPYQKIIQSDPFGFFGFLDDLAERNYTISKSGISLDRQLLFTWKKNGLLPFRSKVDANNKTWNRFSFAELCWILVLITLRKQGVGVERLKQIKQTLFFADFHQVAIAGVSHDLIGPKLSAHFKEKGLSTDRDLQGVQISQDTADEKQLSLFFCLLFSSMIMKTNVVMYVDENANLGIIDLDAMRSSPVTGVQQAYNVLNNPSVITINLTKVITDLVKTVDFSSKWLVNLGTK
jgi:hypothetical protein